MDQILDNLLENYYYNIEESPSYRNVDVLHKAASQQYPDIKREQIKDWYQTQLTPLVYKPLRRKFLKNPIVSKTIDHLWNADLVEIAFPNHNDGYRYLLTVVDNLSKYGWLRKLKNKNQDTIEREFNHILQESGRKPEILGTDLGSEFTSRRFKQLLGRENIQNYYMEAPFKATLVERLNGSLKEIIKRYLFRNNTNKFIDIVDNVMYNYNHTKHSRTKYRPVDVNEENQRKVYQNLYKSRYKELEKQKFRIGDHVLIPDYLMRDPTKMKTKFRRLRYKPDIYVIDKVLYTSPRYKYIVRNQESNAILSNSLYADQLVKTQL
jgi:transposase InsO family protein